MARNTVLVTIALTTVALGAATAAVVAAVVWGGLYSVAGTEPHYQPVFALFETAARQSVRLRARGIETPDLSGDALLQQGVACFRAHCVQCHGAPGVAPGDIGKSMNPLPGPLVPAARHWRPRELYWITRHGMRMTGMPAWERRLTDGQLWAVVAFLQRLPELDPRLYATLAASAAPGCATPVPPQPLRAGDADRGREALSHYACRSCHLIPGRSGSAVHVGPSLETVGRRAKIAGVLPNTPENMVRWLRQTQQVKPMTAMPDLGVSAQDAADIAAYLATLR